MRNLSGFKLFKVGPSFISTIFHPSGVQPPLRSQASHDFSSIFFSLRIFSGPGCFIFLHLQDYCASLASCSAVTMNECLFGLAHLPSWCTPFLSYLIAELPITVNDLSY